MIGMFIKGPDGDMFPLTKCRELLMSILADLFILVECPSFFRKLYAIRDLSDIETVLPHSTVSYLDGLARKIFKIQPPKKASGKHLVFAAKKLLRHFISERKLYFAYHVENEKKAFVYAERIQKLLNAVEKFYRIPLSEVSVVKDYDGKYHIATKFSKIWLRSQYMLSIYTLFVRLGCFVDTPIGKKMSIYSVYKYMRERDRRVDSLVLHQAVVHLSESLWVIHILLSERSKIFTKTPVNKRFSRVILSIEGPVELQECITNIIVTHRTPAKVRKSGRYRNDIVLKYLADKIFANKKEKMARKT